MHKLIIVLPDLLALSIYLIHVIAFRSFEINSKLQFSVKRYVKFISDKFLIFLKTAVDYKKTKIYKNYCDNTFACLLIYNHIMKHLK